MSQPTSLEPHIETKLLTARSEMAALKRSLWAHDPRGHVAAVGAAHHPESLRIDEVEALDRGVSVTARQSSKSTIDQPGPWGLARGGPMPRCSPTSRAGCSRRRRSRGRPRPGTRRSAATRGDGRLLRRLHDLVDRRSHSDRFKAAISERAVNSFVSMWGSSDVGWDMKGYLGGFLYEDTEAYLKVSPLTYAEAITTPLLILHSENDLRCPISRASSSSRPGLLKRPVEMVRFPAEWPSSRAPAAGSTACSVSSSCSSGSTGI